MDASVADELSCRVDRAGGQFEEEMEFQNISNSVLTSNVVSVKENMISNQGVSETALLGIFFVALSMR